MQIIFRAWLQQGEDFVYFLCKFGTAETTNWTVERKLSRMHGEAARKAAIFLGRQSDKLDKKTNGLCCCTVGGHVNNWGIPDWLEKEVRERDKTCVYCGIQMIEKMPPRGLRKAVATWEHIINDASIVSRENIARCCVACNSSKGTKKLSDWIQSNYCKKRRINKDTVAEVVKAALFCPVTEEQANPQR